MKNIGPIATLLAVVLLGVALLVGNAYVAPPPAQNTAAPGAAPAPAEPAPEAAPPGAAPPAAAPPVVAEQRYTGRSAGNETLVALALKDGKAAAYVSDGRRIEAWFEGTLDGDRLTMQGDRGGVLTATVSAKTVLGAMTVDGAEWPFAAKSVQAPAGAYEGRGTVQGVPARVGWIVEESGNVTGLTDLGNRTVPAPRINEKGPVDITVEGQPMAVKAVTGDTAVVE
jgi:hypothetical protein